MLALLWSNIIDSGLNSDRFRSPISFQTSRIPVLKKIPFGQYVLIIHCSTFISGCSLFFNLLTIRCWQTLSLPARHILIKVTSHFELSKISQCPVIFKIILERWTRIRILVLVGYQREITGIRLRSPMHSQREIVLLEWLLFSLSIEFYLVWGLIRGESTRRSLWSLLILLLDSIWKLRGAHVKRR
jgi:hypothetical protein